MTSSRLPAAAELLGSTLALTLDDGTAVMVDVERVDPSIIVDACQRGLTLIIDERLADLREQSLADMAVASTYAPRV